MSSTGAGLSVHNTQLNSHDAGLKATAPHMSHPHTGPKPPGVTAGPQVQSVQPHFQKAHIAASHPARAVPGTVM